MNILQEREFLKFIKLLNDNDVLNELVVVGSWAEYVYEQAGVLPEGFGRELITSDVDFLIGNLRKPIPPMNLLSFVKDSGYIVDTDRFTGCNKIYTENLEIEFLIAQKGAGTKASLKTNLGIMAQTLRHMEVLVNNIETFRCLEFEVKAPSLESFVLHKMIINRERGIKAEKDAFAIMNLLPFLDKEKFNNLFETLSKTEKRKANEFMTAHEILAKRTE